MSRLLVGLVIVVSTLFTFRAEAAVSLVCGFEYNNKNYEWVRGDNNTYFDFINDKGQAVASRPSRENFPVVDFYDVGANTGNQVVSHNQFARDYDSFLNIIPHGITNDGDVLGYVVLANDFPPGFEQVGGSTFLEFSTIFSFVWNQELGFRDINDEVSGISGQNDIGLSTSLARDSELVGQEFISRETHHLLTSDNRESQGRPLGDYETPLPWQIRNSEKNIPVGMLDAIRSQCASSPVSESAQDRFLTEEGYGDSNKRLEFVIGREMVRRALPSLRFSTSHEWVDSSGDETQYSYDFEGEMHESLTIIFDIENTGSIDLYDLTTEVEFLTQKEFGVWYLEPGPDALLSGERVADLFSSLTPQTPGDVEFRIKVTAVDDEGFQSEFVSGIYYFTINGDPTTSLSGTLRFSDNRENANVDLGDEFKLTLDVTTDEVEGGVDNISIDTNFANAENLTIVSSPSIPQGFRMEPGAKRSFEWAVRGDAGGRWRVVSNIAGVNSSGGATSDLAIREGAIVGNELTAEITLDPPSLDDTQDESLGEEPEPIELTATLEVCNNSTDDIDNVTIRRFRALPRISTSIFTVTKLPGGPTIDPISGFVLPDEGKLAKKTCQTFKHMYRIDDDVEVEVDALVDGVSAGGTRLSATDEKTLSVKPKFLLGFETSVIRPQNNTLLPAGEVIQIKGKVKNLSNSHTLKLGPLHPELEGNAGHQSLTWDAAGIDPDRFEIPEYPLTLEPREEQEFHVRVVTMFSDPRHSGNPPTSSGARADITFTPWAIVIDADGKESALTREQIKVTDDAFKLRVAIDDSFPIPEFDYLAVGGGIMYGSAEAAYYFSAGLALGIIELVKLPVTVLWGAMSYQSAVWDSFTEEEKLEFSKDTGFLVASVLLRNAEHAKKDITTLASSADKAVYQTMEGMANDWEVGNHADTVASITRYTGEFVGGEVVMSLAFARLAKNAKAAAALQRADDARQAKNAGKLNQAKSAATLERVEDVLHTVDNGTLADSSTLEKVMGYLPEESAWIKSTCLEFKILCVSRSRAVESIKWVKKFSAKMKPEAIKAKTVSALDELLGYPKIFNGESSVGAMVFKKPEALVAWETKGGNFGDHIYDWVSSRGIDADHPQFEAALRRVAQRADEWKKYEKVYKQWAERKYVDTSFNYTGNGVKKETLWKLDPSSRTKGLEKAEGFRLRELHAPGSPNEAYVMELFDAKAGKWRPITGDVDFLAFTHRDGTSLSNALHAKVLKRFSEGPLGIRHPESATFGEGGVEFIQKQLKPNEAATMFGGPEDELARFVRLDGKKTIWENAGLYKLNFKGGYKYAGEFIPPDEIRAIEQFGAPGPTVSAPAQKPRLIPKQAPDGGPNMGRCDIQTTSDPAAPAVALGKDGRLVEVATDGSVTSSPLHDVCFSDTPGIEVVRITPGATIVINEAGNNSNQVQFTRAIAGDTVLSLLEDPSVVAPGFYGGLEVGQTIAIGVDTDTMELRDIVSVNPLALDSALQFDHGEDDVIVVVEPSPRQQLVEVDTDADGVRDLDDYFPEDPNETTDADRDGVGDNSDTDDDNDGYTDEEELQALSDPIDPSDTPSDHLPDQPTVTALSVSDNTGAGVTLSFALSPFSDPDVNSVDDSVGNAGVRILGPADFGVDAVVYQRSELPLSGTSLKVPVSTLSGGKQYRLFVNYSDATGLVSDESEAQTFTAPEALSADQNINGVDDLSEYTEFADLDGDGTDDREQSAIVLMDSANSSPMSISISTGSLMNVTTLAQSKAVSDVNSGILDHDLLSFRIDYLSDSESVDVTVLFGQSLATRGDLISYDPLSGFSKLSSATIAGEKVDVTLTDGADGDLDGAINGRIVATIGTGSINDAPSSTTTGSGGGGGGCTIASIKGPLDPTLPALILGSIGILAFRWHNATCRKESAQ